MPWPAEVRVGRRPERQRHEPLPALQQRAVVARAEDTGEPVLALREHDRARPRRVPVEPPGELLARRRLAVDLLHQREDRVEPAGLVGRRARLGHFADVRSAAFSARARVRPGDGVLERKQVARTCEDELERPRRVRLDVVATQAQPVGAGRVQAGRRGEGELVAGGGDERKVTSPDRALHVREGAHRPPEPFLETLLRERELSRRLVVSELGQRRVADPVGLDPHAERLELGERLPVERRVLAAVARGRTLVRERLTVVEVRDRDEEHGRVAVLLEHRRRVVQVVAVAVVERDQHRPSRQWATVAVVVEHGVEVDDGVAELAQQAQLLVELRDGDGQRRRGAVVDLVVEQHAEQRRRSNRSTSRRPAAASPTVR